MATITPTSTINPTTMASNWQKGLSANAQKWLNKYLNPRVAFNADPSGSQLAYQTGVQAALARNAYANGMSSADLAAAANNASQYGVTNFANAGTSKLYKYQRKTNSLAAALTAVRQQVLAMPKGPGANNIARMVAWANGMAAYKGRITNS
jgi:hypothetical protein